MKSILRESPVARTPISRPRPGFKYEHAKHGYVKVLRVEDDMVVFKRDTPTGKNDYLNTRQQPVKQFAAQSVNVS